MRRAPAFVLSLLVTAAVVLTLTATQQTPRAVAATSGTLHYTANEEGAYATTTALGYNVHDTGMSASTISALPAGTRALVWAENGKCPTSLTSTFTNFVSAQAGNPRIYGYYLVDEPIDPSSTCVAGIRAMADYIHAHAPGQMAFLLLTDWPGTYAAYAPANSHADLIGLDPYPCRRSGGCDYSLIAQQVDNAVAAGVPLASVVPTYQVFGDATWSPPTSAQLDSILAAWAAAVPNPVLDYTYSWGCQGGSLTDCMSGHPEWQSTMTSLFAGTATSPSPSPSSTVSPTASPSPTPTASPTASPTSSPTLSPTASPTASPTSSPTAKPCHRRACRP